jgi:hypothetical protein
MGGIRGANGCHKNGQMQIQETQRPPEGGWGWMVAFGMALMFVSITDQGVSNQVGNPSYLGKYLFSYYSAQFYVCHPIVYV